MGTIGTLVDLPDWAMARGLRVIATLLALIVLYRVAVRIFTRTLGKMGGGAGGRAVTIRAVLIVTLRASFVFVLFLFILPEFGFQIGPLIASLGIVGLAFSFGAQTLVRDAVSGFFLLVEDLCRVGDEIEIEKVRGRVEALRFRTLRIRREDGAVIFVPYGEIKTLINYSRRSAGE